jgi:hypothetical protein
VIFSCGKCGRTSVFRNEKFGIRAVLAGPLVETNGGGRRHSPLRQG